MNKKIAFVCFGEVNTPIDRLNMKHDEGLDVIKKLGYEVFDGGLVIDDPEYKTADAAIAKIADKDFAALDNVNILCKEDDWKEVFHLQCNRGIVIKGDKL